MPCLISVFIALLRARCYDPLYKSVIQLGVRLYGIHNHGPTALCSVYPVETSTSLYNLYITQRITKVQNRHFSIIYLEATCSICACAFGCKGLNIVHIHVYHCQPQTPNFYLKYHIAGHFSYINFDLTLPFCVPTMLSLSLTIIT